MTRPAFVNRSRWWAWLPILVAAGLWAGLAAVTANAHLWSTAHAVFPWMIRPLYHDLHVVRLGWLTILHGGDPLADAANPFNYPRFVLAAAYLGALHVPPAWLGLLLAACFLGTVLMAVRGDGLLPPGIAAVLVVCPPVLLMVERGNLDAIAFALLAVAFALLRRDQPGSTRCAAAALCVLAASLLKLYPVVVLAILALLSSGAGRRWYAGAFLVWSAWALLHAPEIALVLQKTTRGLEPAYGVALAGSRYYLERVAPRLPAEQARAWLATAMRLSTAAYAAGLLVAIALGWFRGRPDAGATSASSAVIAFISGATIFAGTFLLGANWSYRLVFLLFCLPLLWRRALSPASARWGIALLLGIAIVIYAPFHLPLGWFVVVQVVTWWVAWGLMTEAAMLVRSRWRAGITS